jgi:hypothetical protein
MAASRRALSINSPLSPGHGPAASISFLSVPASRSASPAFSLETRGVEADATPVAGPPRRLDNHARSPGLVVPVESGSLGAPPGVATGKSSAPPHRLPDTRMMLSALDRSTRMCGDRARWQCPMVGIPTAGTLGRRRRGARGLDSAIGNS